MASSEGERTLNALLTYKRSDNNDDLSKMNMDVDILVTTSSEDKLLDSKGIQCIAHRFLSENECSAVSFKSLVTNIPSRNECTTFNSRE